MHPTEDQAPAEDLDAAFAGQQTSPGSNSAADQVVEAVEAAHQASASDSTAWHVGAPAAPEATSTPAPARLATMADLDRLSADLDHIDATLAELDAK